MEKNRDVNSSSGDVLNILVSTEKTSSNCFATPYFSLNCWITQGNTMKKAMFYWSVIFHTWTVVSTPQSENELLKRKVWSSKKKW